MYWRDTFDENIRNGIFALLILQVLSEGDKERRELHREIGVRTDGSFCKTDSLYMTIHKLLLQKNDHIQHPVDRRRLSRNHLPYRGTRKRLPRIRQVTFENCAASASVVFRARNDFRCNRRKTAFLKKAVFRS